MSSDIRIGQRLSFLSSLCTVRYVGPVEGTKGTWLGVEWDDPSAGKHSGEHNGRRYFDCISKSPTGASFVRPFRPADQSLSFVQAVHKKYASSPSDSSTAVGDASVDEPIEISGKVVEEVGFDKIRQQQAALQDLKIVLVDGLGVAGLLARPWDQKSLGKEDWDESVDEIHRTCGSIVELDLSRSLLERWADVVGICKALPWLRVLTLNGNRFRDLSTERLDEGYIHTAFKGVVELSLDETLLSWEEIVALTAMFPDLQTLSLASNAIIGAHTPLSNPRLQSLSFLSNKITNLASLNPLTNLSNGLRILNLRHNQISTLSNAGPFTTVTTLDLSLNSISSLSSLSALPPTFPSLLPSITSQSSAAATKIGLTYSWKYSRAGRMPSPGGADKMTVTFRGT